MIAHPTITSGLAAAACLLALAGCHEDRDPAGGPGSTGTTAESSTSPADAPVADSTGGPAEPGCIDDHYDNHSPAAALDLALDTTDTGSSSSRSSAASTAAPT